MDFAGEAKWARRVDGPRLLRDLERKSAALSGAGELRYALAAREAVEGDIDALTITAEDIFAS
jgi:hypothetical protein